MPMHAQDLSDVWTPKMVREKLVDAVRWAQHNAGSTHPAGVRVSSLYRSYLTTDEDFDIEGWGLRESADDPTEPPPRRRQLTPRQVSALTDALHWPGRYSVAGFPTASRVLNMWVRCKVHRFDFDKAVEHRGEMSRASAYRYRDRALAAIAQGLTRDGVLTW